MRIIKIFFVLEGILLILLPIMNLNSQEFLQQRYNFKLEKWKFHKGEIHSADSGGAIDETNWN